VCRPVCYVVQSLATDESASDHEASSVPFMMNTSSYEREELKEPGYEADHEFSSEDVRGNKAHSVHLVQFDCCVCVNHSVSDLEL